MTTALRTDHDAMIWAADTSVTPNVEETEVILYDQQARRTRKNNMISFVKPLQANPGTSFYNLKRIKSAWLVRAWVDRRYIDVDGFATVTIDAKVYATLDYMMANFTTGKNVTWRYQDQTMTGAITDISIVEQPDDMISDYMRVEITFETGTHL